MPPAKKRKPRPLRCSYREDGLRCPRNGEGNPPLCRAHVLVLQQEAQQPKASALGDVINRFFTGKKVSAEHLSAAAAELLGGMGPQRPAGAGGPPPPNPFGWSGAWVNEQRQRQQQRQQSHAPPPQQGPSDDEIAKAKKVLGFKPDDKLNAADIKRRHRKLALKWHPDRGGSPTKMAELNNAVDILSAAVPR